MYWVCCYTFGMKLLENFTIASVGCISLDSTKYRQLFFKYKSGQKHWKLNLMRSYLYMCQIWMHFVENQSLIMLQHVKVVNSFYPFEWKPYTNVYEELICLIMIDGECSGNWERAYIKVQSQDKSRFVFYKIEIMESV